jgi:ArsR family transcriptional regulator
VKTTVICSLRDPQTAELLAVARRLISTNLRHGQVLLAAIDGADDAVAGAGRVSA